MHHLGRRVMLGVPLGAGSAHVVQLGSIGVEQGVGQSVDEVSEVDSRFRCLAAGGEHPNCVFSPDLFAHDTPRTTFGFCRLSVRSLLVDMERPYSPLLLRRNLLKMSRKSPAIPLLSATVAE